jgi:hypothetical protein
MPMLTIRLVTGAKNPISVYPANGVAPPSLQVPFQIIAQPAMTGRQQSMSMIRRTFLKRRLA